jgi:hypothetical protein
MIMICRGCETSFEGFAAYCPRCEIKQLTDSVSPAPVPARPGAQKSPHMDFDTLYQRGGDLQPRRNSERQPVAATNPYSFIWFASLALVGLALSRLQLPTFGLEVSVGYTVGGMLVALVIAGICRLFAKGGFGKIFLITWSVVLALNGLQGLLQAQGVVPALNADALKSQQDAIYHLMDVAQGNAASSSSQPVASASTSIVDNRPYVEPEGDALTDVINQVTTTLGQYNQRVAELNGEQQMLGLETVLAPQNLVTRTGVQHGRQILTSYGRILGQYKTSFDNYADKIQKIFESAPSASRQRLMPAFQQHVTETRGAINAFISVERQISTEISSVLDIAQANLGTSRAQGSTLYLPAHALLQYRQHLTSLRALVRQEDVAAQQMQQLRRMAISQMVAVKSTYDAR